MTLQTLTGPSIRDALADARRLFGADVVLLQSAPAVGGAPASVTVAFDVASPAPAPASPPRATAPVATAPRVYGYGAPRKPRPAATESVAAALLADLGLAGGDPPAGEHAPAADTSPAGTARRASTENASATSAAPPVPSPLSEEEGQGEGDTPTTSPASPPAGARPIASPAPVASAAALAALQARLADLEAALDAVRPVPAPARPPVVFVGPAGDGKSSLALGLACTPALADARCPAAIVVADADAPDAAARFWTVGVPAAVVRTADEVRDALRTFADADLLVVDTPPLSLDPARAASQVARLGTLLAPLGAVEVVLAVSAARSRETLAAGTLDALGLRPDALALTRLDEAPAAADRWTRALALPLRFVSAAPGAIEPAPTPTADDAPPLSDIVLGPLVGPLRTEATTLPEFWMPTPTTGDAISAVHTAPEPMRTASEVIRTAAEPIRTASEVMRTDPEAVRTAAPPAAPRWRPLAAERARTIPAPPASDLWSLVAPASPSAA